MPSHTLRFIVPFLFLITLGFFGTHISYAQTTTATSTPEEVSTSSEPTPPPVIEETPIRNVILEARAQKRIINLAANISNRFDAIILRLDNIATRLTVRLEKMNNEGFDTAAAGNSLSAAKAALSEAKANMSDIDTAVVSAIGSQEPKTEWQNVRMKYMTARDSIRTAHTELKNTISALKNAPKRVQQNEETASTTDEALPN